MWIFDAQVINTRRKSHKRLSYSALLTSKPPFVHTFSTFQPLDHFHGIQVGPGGLRATL